MTFNPNNLKQIGEGVFLGGIGLVSCMAYITSDSLAEMQKPGYFDDHLKYLPKVTALTIISAQPAKKSKGEDADIPDPVIVQGALVLRSRKATRANPRATTAVFTANVVGLVDAEKTASSDKAKD